MPNKKLTPKPIGLPEKLIWQLADLVSAKMKYRPSSSLHKLIERLGGTIEFINGNDAISKTSYIKVENSSFTIYLSSDNFPLRERYILAHELGHYILHSRCGTMPIEANHADYASDELANGVEFEAHEFACAFLISEAEYKKIAQKTERAPDAIMMAAHFYVPLPIAQKRLLDFTESRYATV